MTQDKATPAAPASAASPRPRPTGSTGERRQITALFYDIVGSTELLNRLDPEDLGVLQQKTHALASEVIERQGGTLDQVMGDGGCAFFGFPVPAEDAAEGAVEAALEFLERYAALAAFGAPGEAPRVRIGIATGLVVINPPGAASSPIQNLLVGFAPTLAARLQALAEPNTIAVSDQTYRLCRGVFEFQDLGTAKLKGFEEPHRIWRPIARHANPDRFSRAGGFDLPLVGRAAELARLMELWQLAQTGRGQMVELVGEPGIGKSRLTAELRRSLAESQAQVRMFQCQPRGNTRPLHPFIDALRYEAQSQSPPAGEAGAGTPGTDDPLDRLLAGSSVEARQIVSFILAADRPTERAHPDLAALSGEQFREKALTAAMEIVASWCHERPQVLIIEDLHWADTLTIALFERITKALPGMAMLLVATTRNVSAPVAELPHAISITLQRLEAADIGPLVAAAWHPLPVPAGLAAFVADRSDGVPLFATELASLLKERTDPAHSDPAAWAGALREGSITTLEDLLAARLASLGPARNLAQLASVIGREFSLDVLARLAEVGRSDGSFDNDLTALRQSGLVHRVDKRQAPVYRFRHVLIQDVAYNSLLKSQRRDLHNYIVAMALDIPTIELTDEVMAWHCEQAGRNRLAAQYAIQAGEACAIRSAPREAARMLDLATRSLDACEAGAETDEMRLRLLAAHGPVAVAVHGKGSPEARAIYDQGVALCRDRAIEDREKWFPLYWGWWFTSPNGMVKRKRSEAIIRDLAAANHPEIRLQAHHCSWAANFHAGNHSVCLNAIEQGLMLYDPERARESRIRFGDHDAKVCGLAERSLTLWLTGQAASANESMDTALHWAEATQHLGSICHAHDFAMMLGRYQCRHEDVAELALRLRGIAEANALPGLKAKSKIFAGWARAMTGELAAGFAEFEDGFAQHRAIGTDEDLPIYADMHAALLERQDRHADARHVLDTAIEEARRSANLFWMPELMRRRAGAVRAAGADPVICRTDLVQALALAEHQGARSLADRARADLERFEREQEADLEP